MNGKIPHSLRHHRAFSRVTRRSSRLWAACLGLGLATSVQASTHEWNTHATLDWRTDSAWTPLGVPNHPTHNAIIPQGRAVVGLVVFDGILLNNLTVSDTGSIKISHLYALRTYGVANFSGTGISEVEGFLRLTGGGTISAQIDIASTGDLWLEDASYEISNTTINGPGEIKVTDSPLTLIAATINTTVTVTGGDVTVGPGTTTVTNLSVIDPHVINVLSGSTLAVSSIGITRLNVADGGTFKYGGGGSAGVYLDGTGATLAPFTPGDWVEGPTIIGNGTVNGKLRYAQLLPASDVDDISTLGTLTILGDLDLSGSLYDVDVAADGSSDLLLVHGDVTLGGGLYIHIGSLTSAELDANDYVIIQTVGGQILGDLLDIWDVELEDGKYLLYDYNTSHIFALELRNDNTQLVLTAVPEPSVGLLLLPLTLLARRRRG